MKKWPLHIIFLFAFLFAGSPGFSASGSEAVNFIQKKKESASERREAVAGLRHFLSRPVASPLAEAVARARLGSLLLGPSHSRSAISQLLTADSLYRMVRDTAGRISVLKDMASFCDKYGVLTEAEKYYAELQEIYDGLGKPGQAGLAALHRADIMVRDGRVQGAATFISSSVINNYGKGDKFVTASACQKLAEINRLQKNYRRAESLILSRALPLYRSAGNKEGRIGCFNVLGKIYQDQKRYSEAKWFFIQALMQSEELHNIPGKINALTGLALVKTAIGDAALAAGDLRQAQLLAKSAGDLRLLSNVDAAFARFYRASGNHRAGSLSSFRAGALSDSAGRLTAAQAESVRTASIIHVPKAPAKTPARPESSRMYIGAWLALVVLVFLILLLVLSRKRKRK